ncbi:cytochrome c oxidase subunit II [Egicoccus sp. AB-alg2]|uniref:cytochrome c oxidase subunit II n=1 Tax=Egicoccus sp. AB-alg2 TaxID=3242693 RepID=UPI00359DA942
MSRAHVRVLRPLAVLASATLVLAACGEGSRDAITTPVSPEAGEINWLWWFSLALGTLVYVAVLVLLAVPLVRARRRARRDAHLDDLRTRVHGRDGGQRASAASEKGDPSLVLSEPPDTSRPLDTAPAALVDEPLAAADPGLAAEARRDAPVRSRLIWWGGLILPAIILLVLLVAASTVGARTAHVAEDGDLVIEVVGHMFWWEVVYPDHDVVTANEIVIPTDQRVRLVLTTDDVIHSFWIPRLHGKVDMIPGTVNDLTFTATEEGFFRGHCAEYCGIAHAQMVKFVEAVSPAAFDTWVEQQQQAPVGAEVTETTAEGERLFFATGCADCHAVRGTNAIGAIGPDLSHLASRRTLAAGIVPNTREQLGRLIVDPWGVKPGNPMPPTVLSDEELEALLDYLETFSAEGAARMEGGS